MTRGTIQNFLAPFTVGIVALGLAAPFCAAGFGVAHAQTLQQFNADQRQPQNFFEALFPHLIDQRMRRQRYPEPVEIEEVEAPKYYTYKAERMVRIDLAPLVPVPTGDADPQAAEPVAFDRRMVESAMDDSVIPAQPDAFSRLAGSFSRLAVMAEPEVAAAIVTYYKETQSLMWLNGDLQPNARAKSVLTVLEDAASYGLDPADYAVALPTNESLEAAARFEVAMTARAIRYGMDAAYGRINPNLLSGYHDLPRQKNMARTVLDELTGGGLPARTLIAMHPDNAQFRALTEELGDLEPADDALIVIPANILIRPGDHHEQVPNILAAVAQRGSPELRAQAEELHRTRRTPAGAIGELRGGQDAAFSSPDLTAQIEGVLETGVDPTLYTLEIADLVRAFQKENDLAADGVVGPNTVSKLTDIDPQTKRRQVLLSMERLRWHPHDLGSPHVFINQPEFRARFMENDRAVLDMRVIVGKRSNQTSFFHDVIETVEYNPYWGIPRSILVNEYLPKLRENPAYLDERDYEVTDRSGQRIPSAAIDWYAVGSELPFDVRQRPGPANALGQVKILFPNKHAIYMHDTPARSLFERSHRAYSHGCVRLHRPREMAAAVLGKSTDYVASQIAVGHSSEDVNRRIPVYVAYFTAWPNDDGEVHYFADSYGRDAYLLKAIDATRNAREASI